MIHHDDVWPLQAARGNRLADAINHDAGQAIALGDAFGEGKGEVVGLVLETFQITPEGRTDRPLRADEKRHEDKLVFASRELGADPRQEGPRRRAAEVGGGNPVTVLPRQRLHGHAGQGGQRRGRAPQILVRGGFE